MIELRNKILELINNADLPLEAIMFVLKDLYRDAIEKLQTIVEKKEAGED